MADPAESPSRQAESFVALIDAELDDPELSDFEREVLERSRDAGEVSISDYEDAFARYKKCVGEAGYEPTFTKRPDGVYAEELPLDQMDSQAKLDAYVEATGDCANGTTMRIEALFNEQQNNPGLLADPREVALACLRRVTDLSADYGAEQFDADGRNGFRDAPFDTADAQVSQCLVGAGFAVAVS
jgi:hypothetical protein